MIHVFRWPIFILILGLGLSACEGTGNDDPLDDDDSDGGGCCVTIEGLDETVELCDSEELPGAPALLVSPTGIQLSAALDGGAPNDGYLVLYANTMTEAGTYSNPGVDYHDDANLYTNNGTNGSFTLDALPPESEDATGSFTVTLLSLGMEQTEELNLTGTFCAVRTDVD